MRVLVAIDGSERAGVAVDLVADVAWPAGTEILVAEAVGRRGGRRLGLDPTRVGRVRCPGGHRRRVVTRDGPRPPALSRTNRI